MIFFILCPCRILKPPTFIRNNISENLAGYKRTRIKHAKWKSNIEKWSGRFEPWPILDMVCLLDNNISYGPGILGGHQDGNYVYFLNWRISFAISPTNLKFLAYFLFWIGIVPCCMQKLSLSQRLSKKFKR